ncbi:unnamed protein product, partial [Callosobruchus maculatus]
RDSNISNGGGSRGAARRGGCRPFPFSPFLTRFFLRLFFAFGDRHLRERHVELAMKVHFGSIGDDRTTEVAGTTGHRYRLVLRL